MKFRPRTEKNNFLNFAKESGNYEKKKREIWKFIEFHELKFVHLTEEYFRSCLMFVL